MHWHRVVWVVVIGASVAPTASAQAPPFIPVQGFLADAAGAPVTGEVEMELRLYSEPEGGTPLFQELQQVEVRSGSFTALLGAAGSLDLSLFADGSVLFLGMHIDGEELTPRLPVGSVPYAALAERAVDADRLGGIAADDVQRRVESSCPSGSCIREIAADGAVMCEPGYTDADALAAVADGDLEVSGTLRATSFHNAAAFDEDLPLETYPLGVSWQAGRGSNAAAESLCRYGIVQTMYFSDCRARQICYERDGAVFSRYLATHCDASGPWGSWVPASP